MCHFVIFSCLFSPIKMHPRTVTARRVFDQAISSEEEDSTDSNHHHESDFELQSEGTDVNVDIRDTDSDDASVLADTQGIVTPCHCLPCSCSNWIYAQRDGTWHKVPTWANYQKYPSDCSTDNPLPPMSGWTSDTIEYVAHLFSPREQPEPQKSPRQYKC